MIHGYKRFISLNGAKLSTSSYVRIFSKNQKTATFLPTFTFFGFN